ncbi:recombinase family protein [Microbacterium sp. NPDC055683]
MTHADTTDTEIHQAAECPECFVELRRDNDWWQARPAGSRLVGLVVQRDDMPSVIQQRDDLTRFGVPIESFRHPAPNILESWEQRLERLFSHLKAGDVLVVASVHALGRDAAEEVRTIAALTRRGVVVKVLDHGRKHLHDAPSVR